MRPIQPNQSVPPLNNSLALAASLLPSPSANHPFKYEQEQKYGQLPDARRGGKNPSSQHKHIKPVAAARDRPSFLQAAWSRSVSAKRCLPVHARSRRKVDSPSTSTASEAITVAGTDRGIDGVASGSMFRFPAFADGLKHNFDATCLRFVAASFVREKRLQLFISCLPPSCYSGVVADA